LGDVVIVAYRPKPGQAQALAALLEDHVPHLRRLGLATDRPSTLVRAACGTFVEVFEWREGGVEAAHAHPEVLAMWGDYAAVCDCVPLRELAETGEMFATFTPA
jgi:hypothetical protein